MPIGQQSFDNQNVEHRQLRRLIVAQTLLIEAKLLRDLDLNALPGLPRRWENRLRTILDALADSYQTTAENIQAQLEPIFVADE